MKKSDGITLVALVVTIIILLILAGITIGQLTENGLFEKAKLSKEKQENAKIEEDTTLADYENKIGEYITSSNRNLEGNMLDIIKYLAGEKENSQYENEINQMVNSSETMNQICSSKNLFTLCANSKVIMEKICDSSIAREAMYNNAAITEEILSNSEIAMQVMEASSRTEVINDNTALQISSATPITMYDGKAFVFSISQNLNSETNSAKYTIHGNYLIGDELIYTRTYQTFGGDGKAYRVNKFASKVVLKSVYLASDPAAYPQNGFVYIFKI